MTQPKFSRMKAVLKDAFPLLLFLLFLPSPYFPIKPGATLFSPKPDSLGISGSGALKTETETGLRPTEQLPLRS